MDFLEFKFSSQTDESSFRFSEIGLNFPLETGIILQIFVFSMVELYTREHFSGRQIGRQIHGQTATAGRHLMETDGHGQTTAATERQNDGHGFRRLAAKNRDGHGQFLTATAGRGTTGGVGWRCSWLADWLSKPG